MGYPRWAGWVRLKYENSGKFWLLTAFVGCGRLANGAVGWSGGAKWRFLGRAAMAGEVATPFGSPIRDAAGWSGGGKR